MWGICSGRCHNICTVTLHLGASCSVICFLSHRYHYRHYVLSTSNKYKWNQYHRKRVQKLWEERLRIEEYNKKFLEDNEKFIPTDKKGLFRQDEFYYSDLDAT